MLPLLPLAATLVDVSLVRGFLFTLAFRFFLLFVCFVVTIGTPLGPPLEKGGKKSCCYKAPQRSVLGPPLEKGGKKSCCDKAPQRSVLGPPLEKGGKKSCCYKAPQRSVLGPPFSKGGKKRVDHEGREGHEGIQGVVGRLAFISCFCGSPVFLTVSGFSFFAQMYRARLSPPPAIGESHRQCHRLTIQVPASTNALPSHPKNTTGVPFEGGQTDQGARLGRESRCGWSRRGDGTGPLRGPMAPGAPFEGCETDQGVLILVACVWPVMSGTGKPCGPTGLLRSPMAPGAALPREQVWVEQGRRRHGSASRSHGTRRVRREGEKNPPWSPL